MRVELSRLSEEDLEQIADFIARDNPRRALTFVRDDRVHVERVVHTARDLDALLGES